MAENREEPEREMLQRRTAYQVIEAGTLFREKNGKFELKGDIKHNFWALVHKTEVGNPSEERPVPTNTESYELWKLHPDKLKKLFNNTYGMCKHTMKTYVEIQQKWMKEEFAEHRNWRKEESAVKIAFLTREELKGAQIRGCCKACERFEYGDFQGDDSANVIKLLKHYVNNNLFIEPFVDEKNDAEDKKFISETQQWQYHDFRLFQQLSLCLVPNNLEIKADIDDCRDKDDEWKFNGEELSRIGRTMFSNVHIYNSSDPKYANARVSQVQEQKLKALGRKTVSVYTFNFETTSLAKDAVQNVKGILGHPFGVGGSPYRSTSIIHKRFAAPKAGYAKQWRKALLAMTEEKKLIKEEFENKVCREALERLASTNENEWESILEYKDDSQYKISLYPQGDGESYPVKWNSAEIRHGKNSEIGELRCSTSEDFACSFIDACVAVLQMKNFNSTCDGGVETETPFEYKLFKGNFLNTPENPYLTVDFVPENKTRATDYGLVNRKARVIARLKSNYEVGFPKAPFAFYPLKAFGNNAFFVNPLKYVGKLGSVFGEDNAGYKLGEKVVTYLGEDPYWDRKVVLEKGFWSDEDNKTGEMKTLNVFWKSVGHEVTGAGDLKPDDRAKLAMYFLRIEKTSQDIKPRETALRALTSVLNSMGTTKSTIPYFSEVICIVRSFINIGLNSLDYKFRTECMNALFNVMEEWCDDTTKRRFQSQRSDGIKSSGKYSHERLFLFQLCCLGIAYYMHGFETEHIQKRYMGVEALRGALSTFKKLKEFCLKQRNAAQKQHALQVLLFLTLSGNNSLNTFTSEAVRYPEIRSEREQKEILNLKSQLEDLREVLAGNNTEANLLNDFDDGFDIRGIVLENGSKYGFNNLLDEIEDEDPALEIERNVQAVTDALNETLSTINEERAKEEYMDLSDLYQSIGYVVDRLNDHTCKVSVYMKFNTDEWTKLNMLDIDQDRLTKDLLRRPVEILKTQSLPNKI